MYKIILQSLIVLTLITVAGCGTPQKYDASLADGTSGKNNWKKDGWWNLNKTEGRKVAIAEFSVSYVTKRDAQVGRNQLNLLTAARVVGVGQREYAFEDSLKTGLPDELYAVFVRALEAEGFEVMPRQTVANSAAMDKVSVGKDGAKKSGGGYYHGVMGGGGSQRVEIYPVSDLPRIKDNLFTSGSNMMALAQAAGELDADILLRVHLRVGLYKGQATADEGSIVSVIAAPKSYQDLGGNTKYTAQTHGQLSARQTLFYPEPVVDGKEFEAFKGNVYTVRSDDYRRAILPLVETYSKMAVSLLK